LRGEDSPQRRRGRGGCGGGEGEKGRQGEGETEWVRFAPGREVAGLGRFGRGGVCGALAWWFCKVGHCGTFWDIWGAPEEGERRGAESGTARGSIWLRKNGRRDARTTTTDGRRDARTTGKHVPLPTRGVMRGGDARRRGGMGFRVDFAVFLRIFGSGGDALCASRMRTGRGLSCDAVWG
jgi:hypothetical protein